MVELVWSFAERAERALTMPVRRDPRTGRWYFRAIVRLPDGTRLRLYGTPGVPGPYQDLVQSKIGAQEAERRAISEAMTGKPRAGAATTATEEAPKKTIKEHAENFVQTYKPSSKPSEKREKQRVLDSHLLPFFGAMTIEGLTQADLDRFARSELDRGMAVKTVNNRLAVLSTLIKYVKGERSRLRFKLDGMAGELQALPLAEVETLLSSTTVSEAFSGFLVL